MAVQRVCQGKPCVKLRRGGFTLMELIVALAVLSVGVAVFVSLYSASVDLARTARNRMMATTLAEEQLESILAQPKAYVWEVHEKHPELHPFPIRQSLEEPRVGNPIALPSALPPEERALGRTQAQYAQFRWQAQARLPEANAPYYEVTVMLRWRESGRPQVLALSSLLPCAQAPELVLTPAPDKKAVPAQATAEKAS